MNRVTSSLRVAIPKRIAERHGIRPGDQVEWVSDGKDLRLEPVSRREPLDVAERLKLFDESTERQRERESRLTTIEERGWSREELYNRARPR